MPAHESSSVKSAQHETQRSVTPETPGGGQAADSPLAGPHFDARQRESASAPCTDTPEQATDAGTGSESAHPYAAAAAQLNRAVQWERLGQLENAEKDLTQVLQLVPGWAIAHANLGNVLRQQGRLHDALREYHASLRNDPGAAEVWVNLGATYHSLSRLREAAEAYRQALRLQPNLLEALNNLGLALLAQDNAADAAVIFNRAVELSPQRAAFWNHQGLALDRLGHAEIARQSFETAVTLDPEFQPGWRNLALACLRYGILDRAAQAIEHWRCLTPDDVECLAVAGLVAHAQGDLGAAERDFRDLLEIEPHDVTARNNLGVVLQAAGRLDEAEMEFRAVLDRDPTHPLAASNRLLNAVYSPERPPDELLRAHREWGARFERAAGSAEPASWRPVRSSSGVKLRIGFVSPDFRRHPVAAFLRPLFRHLDRGRFELYCYSDVAVQDSWTLEFKALSTAWRDSCRLGADALVDRIRADDIDVLVDLAGHTAGNRLAVFARRGAPVQLSWLGYCPPTGLSTIDARLSDAFLDPDDSGESGCVRLAHGYCVYSPPDDAPDVVPPPCLSGRPVTFAAFHHLPKLNAQVLALWSRLLKEIPDARLLVARHTLRGRTRVDLGRRMESAGIDLDRVEFRAPEPSPIQHLEFYAETDLALDCFPWAGHTTACEALWMGVPTVTLAGAAPWQRTVAGALVLAGLPEFVAASQDEYLEIAVRAAADRTRLGELRQGLRDRLRRSALLDGRTFARGWEQAVRQVYDSKTGGHDRLGGAPQPGKEASCTLP